MELGLLINKFDFPGGAPEALSRIASRAEAAGVRYLAVPDHFFQMPIRDRTADQAMLESHTTLAYLASRTSTVQLGVLVASVTHRHPGVLAKIATTLDVLSAGRFTLGIGAGWYEREHHGLGIPLPTLKERFVRLEETARICLQMWDPADNGPFAGEHYRLAETLCVPAATAAPHPPLLIAGGGEQKTLRLVARYADACNIPGTPGEVAHKLDVLRAHCDTAGRDFATIEKTANYTGKSAHSADAGRAAADVRAYADLGVTKVVMTPPDDIDPAAWIGTFCADLVPRLADLN